MMEIVSTSPPVRAKSALGQRALIIAGSVIAAVVFLAGLALFLGTLFNYGISGTALINSIQVSGLPFCL